MEEEKPEEGEPKVADAGFRLMRMAVGASIWMSLIVVGSVFAFFVAVVFVAYTRHH